MYNRRAPLFSSISLHQNHYFYVMLMFILNIRLIYIFIWSRVANPRTLQGCGDPRTLFLNRVRGGPIWKNQHCNGAGSDRAATVREAFPASAIWRLEERVGTGAFETCLQGHHWGSGDLPVVALLVSKGVASPQHQKLVRGGSPKSRFKRDI